MSRPESTVARFDQLGADRRGNRLFHEQFDLARLGRSWLISAFGNVEEFHRKSACRQRAFHRRAVGPDFALQRSLGYSQSIGGPLLMASTFFERRENCASLHIG